MNKQVSPMKVVVILMGVGFAAVWVAVIALRSPQETKAKSAKIDHVDSRLQEPQEKVSDYTPCMRSKGEFLEIVSPKRQPKQLTIVCPQADSAPVIDGVGNDAAWSTAPSITTLDLVSQRPIKLRAIHKDESVFFLVSYPDTAPSTTQKSFAWDDKAGIYKPFGDREDMFIFKWRMPDSGPELSLKAGQAHTADIWFWKACRTNPVGYADDKWQSYSAKPHESAQKVRVAGRTMYLLRGGDEGQSAYKERIPIEYQGRFAPRFTNHQPQGSRADVRAKGHWENGVWTIEFARKLDTGNKDDVPFVIGGEYTFIVSFYEIYGGVINPEWTQPLYKIGDAFDHLTLKIVR